MKNEYMNYLTTVVSKFRLNGPINLTSRGAEIVKWWDLIEQRAAEVGYDVFLSAPVRSLATGLTQLLYITGSPEGDEKELRYKDAEYGSSWLARGGVGAFFVTARKADRIKTQLSRYDYDLAKIFSTDTRLEGIRDDIGDLRRYLILWECEAIRRELAAISPVKD